MSSLVSVIIPAYNAAQYLSRSVSSALAQTHEAIEVVIVDDGSTDGTAAVSDELAARDGRVKVIHQENQGPAEARRRGFEASIGDYIAFLDADDELLPDAVQYLYGKCLEQQLDLAYGSFVKVKGDKSYEVPHAIEGVITGDEFLHYLFDRRCMCATWGNLCLREVYSDDVFPPRGLVFPNEDVLMNICLSAHVKRVGIFNKPVLKYYFVPTSLTVTSCLLTKQDKWEVFFRLVEENLKKRGKLEELDKELLCMKIERLAFYAYPLDTNRPWIKEILEDKRYQLPRRYAILQRLLHHPRLCRWCVINNRRVKRLFK